MSAARAPLLRGEDAIRALACAERIAASPAALAASGPPESSERYGGAALLAEALARAGCCDRETVRARTRDAFVLAPDRLSLLGGAGTLAVVLAALDPERAAFGTVRARLATELARSLREPVRADPDEPRSYDLVQGAAGRAVALALASGEPVPALARFAGDFAGAIERRLAADGDEALNLGVSHGIAGVLAALNLALPADAPLAARYVGLLLRCSHAVDGARRWGPLWRPATAPSARRAWCYQTVGIAAVIADRARIERDGALYALAADALAAVLDDPAAVPAADPAQDAALCHGGAGVASIAWSFAGDARFAPHAERLARAVLAFASGETNVPGGFLDGALGIAQFLTDAATAQERRWLPLIGLLPDRLRPAAPHSPPA